jgi:hypothetical protein
LQENERKEFINYWLEEGYYKKEDIVTIAWIIDICIMDYKLLSEKWKLYVHKWTKTYSLIIKSIVTKSWLPSNLEKFGELDLSKKVIDEILSEQSNNGSWNGDFDKTIRISYALLHYSLTPVSNIKKSIEFSNKFILKGYFPDAQFTSKLLKFYFKSGYIETDLSNHINEKINYKATSKIEEIKKEIASGNILHAIDMLRIRGGFRDNSLDSAIILQSSKLADVDKEYTSGNIGYETYRIEKTKITNGLLGLLDLLEQ